MATSATRGSGPRYVASSPSPTSFTKPYFLLALTFFLLVIAFTAPAFPQNAVHFFTTQRSVLSDGVIVAFSTAPNMEVARKIAEGVIDQRVAACVNIVPGAESVYWWEGKVVKEGEVLMIIKTRSELMEKLNQVVGDLHPYEVHELVGMSVRGGNEKYLRWVLDETKGAEVGAGARGSSN